MKLKCNVSVTLLKIKRYMRKACKNVGLEESVTL